MSVWRTYKLTPPDDEAFFLAIASNGKMITNRSGTWAVDKLFDGKTVSVADVLNPMYLLSEWDVERVQPYQIPSSKAAA